MELDTGIYENVLAISARADALLNLGRFDAAIDEYTKAWNLLPEPRQQWDAALWLLGSTAEAAFIGGRYGPVIEALEFAMLACPDAVGNPLLHLRLGQAYFEKGRFDESANELVRAYVAEGEQMFMPEDPKYLAFLFTRIKR